MLSQKFIQEAIKATTCRGDSHPNQYRLASWLGAMGYWSPFMMQEIRAYLGMPHKEIDPEIAGPITSILEAEK